MGYILYIGFYLAISNIQQYSQNNVGFLFFPLPAASDAKKITRFRGYIVVYSPQKPNIYILMIHYNIGQKYDKITGYYLKGDIIATFFVKIRPGSSKFGVISRLFLWYLDFFLTILRRDLNWQKEVQISPKKQMSHHIF